MIIYVLIIIVLNVLGSHTSAISGVILPFKCVNFNISFCDLGLQSKNFTIQVLTRQTSSSVSSTILNSFYLFSKPFIQFQIWNFQLNQITFSLNIYQNTSNIICIDNQIQKNEHQQNPLNLAAFSILYKSSISNYMLPFNFLSQKKLKVFLNFQNTQIVAESYKNQPFLATFWNQYAYTTLIIPWLPYFSKCNNTKNRIFLAQLLHPKNCLIDSNAIEQNEAVCPQKMNTFKCLLQQNKVINPQSDPWYISSQNNLFYIYPTFGFFSQLEYYYSDGSLNSYLSQYKQSLISINYVNNVGIYSYPKQFVFNFYLAGSFTGSNLTFQIVQCQLNANQLSSQLPHANQLSSNQAFVKINVKYLDNWQRFNYLSLQFYFYLPLIVVWVIIWKLFSFVYSKLFVSFNQKNKNINLLPSILKGLFYASITILTFGLACYQISVISNFAFVGSSFDGDQSPQILQIKYKGRNGLTLMLCGIFCLLQSVGQTQKIISLEQAKQIIEDNSYQKNETFYQDSVNNQKPIFLVKNISSKRNYVVIVIIIHTLFIIYVYNLFLRFDYAWKMAILLIVKPLFSLLHHIFFRFVFKGQFLYFIAIKLSIQSIIFLDLLRAKQLSQLILLYACVNMGTFVLLLLEYVIYTLCQTVSEEPNMINLLLMRHFRKQILQISQEFQYQRSLKFNGIYCVNLAIVFFKLLMFSIALISITDNQIYMDFISPSKRIYIIVLIIAMFIPFQYIFIKWSMQVFQAICHIKMWEVLKYNQFKFHSRKIRWLNDSFSNSSTVQVYYRSFQKYNFSSQAFLILFQIGISFLLIFFGIKILIVKNYVIFTDPALIVISPLIWIMGRILAVINSFVVLKLKLYQIKEENKSRTQLTHLQKLIKVESYENFLDIEAIKDYFLIFNKQWIVNNLNKILLKEQFLQNKGQLINKYKLYRNFLKKKNRVQRQKKYNSDNEAVKKTSYIRQKTKYQIVKLKQNVFQTIAKPALQYWLFAARQKIFLKAIVQTLKNQKKKDVCQFCNIDFDLQSIQKKQFTDIYHEFRVLNVGRLFVDTEFFQFYKEKQDFITICSECNLKKLYLSKTTIKNSNQARIVILKWHFKAKSTLLHRIYKKQPLVQTIGYD